MKTGESIDQLANFLAAYALDLEAVIYDRACALQLNACGRFPALFSDCRFILDSLHKWNHGCAEAVKVRPHDVPENSAICESLHAKMGSSIRGTGNMRFATLMQMLSVFYAFWNARQRRKATNRGSSSTPTAVAAASEACKASTGSV